MDTHSHVCCRNKIRTFRNIKEELNILGVAEWSGIWATEVIRPSVIDGVPHYTELV